MTIAEEPGGAPRSSACPPPRSAPCTTRSAWHRVLFLSASLALAAGVVVASLEGTASAQQQVRSGAKKNKKKDKEKKAEKEAEKKDAAAEEAKRETAHAAPEPPKDEKKEDDEVEPRSPTAIYASGELAVTRSDVGLIVDDTGFDRTGANGLAYALAAGYRKGDRRYGLRWTVHDTTELTLWSLALSAGYELPMKPLTPVLSAHLGYVFTRSMQAGLFRSSLPEGTVEPPTVRMRGALLGIEAEASYWLASYFSVGPFLGADLMLLSREKAELPRSIFGIPAELPDEPLYRESGTGLGVNFTLGVRGTFDVGL